jgi:hypothetical protein
MIARSTRARARVIHVPHTSNLSIGRESVDPKWHWQTGTKEVKVKIICTKFGQIAGGACKANEKSNHFELDPQNTPPSALFSVR